MSPTPPQNDRSASPADRLISSLDGTYFKLGEVAVLIDRHPITLRRLIKKNRVKAPSYQVRQGDNVYYLFTPEDVEELKQYYGTGQGQIEPRVPKRAASE